MKTFISLFILLSFAYANADTANVDLDVNYKTGAVDIFANENYVVDNLNELVNAFPKSKVYIIGHTDSSGSDVNNLKLSEARANALYIRLLKSGLNKDQISAKGMGETAPIADNNTSAGRSANRRVVAVFAGLSNDEKMKMKTMVASKKGLSFVDTENTLVDKFVSAKQKAVANVKASVPAVPAVQAEAPKVKASYSNSGNYRYAISTGVYNSTVDVENKTDSSEDSEWSSDHSLPIGLAAQFKVANSAWLGFKVFGHRHDYKIDSSPGFTWDEERTSLIRCSLISDYEGENWGIGFDVDFNREAMIMENAGAAVLTYETLVGATLRGQYKLFDSNEWSSRLGVAVSYPFATISSDETDAEGELGYNVFLDLMRNKVIVDYGIRAKLFYGQRNFTNAQSDQTEDVYGLVLSLDTPNWL